MKCKTRRWQIDWQFHRLVVSAKTYGAACRTAFREWFRKRMMRRQPASDCESGGFVGVAVTLLPLLILFCSIVQAQQIVESGTADAQLRAAGYVQIPVEGGGWFWGKPGERPETFSEATIRFKREDQSAGRLTTISDSQLRQLGYSRPTQFGRQPDD